MSESQSLLLFESNPLPSLLVERRSLRILAANQAAAQQYGYARQELLALTLAQLSAADDEAQVAELAAELWQSGGGAKGGNSDGKGSGYGRGYWRQQRRDGRVMDVEINCGEAQFAGQDAWLLVVRDISRQRQTERELQATNERFRLAETASNGFVYEWHPATNAVKRSDGVRQVLGYTQEEMLADREWWSKNIHPDDMQGSTAVIYQAFGAEESYSIEYRVRHKDGHYVWVWDRGLLMRDAQGVVERVIGSTVDITERKEVEGEREQLLSKAQAARIEADAANRAKDEFLAVVSHELRAPLNAMLGWSRILQSRQVDEATQAKALETIERSAKMQAQIIEDLLDTARIISGKLRIEVQPVNLVPVVNAALEVVRPAAEAKGIKIRVRFDAINDVITGDAERLQQVVWNLLSNAIKFTPQGGKVRVELRRSDPYLQIAVSDTGKGIEKDFMPYVFDRFYQADSSSTRRHSGLGLGLSLVRHLVELHGGTITAESAGENQGATFIVNLPVRAVRPQTNGLEPAVLQRYLSRPIQPVLEGLRVLVVDDETDARELVTTLLKQYGAEVTPTASASEAFAVLSQTAGEQLPDCIISDIGMPDEDGYSLLRRVRAWETPTGRRIPAIALTAYSRATDRIKALESGFQSHVPKPVEADELMIVIASLTGRKLSGSSQPL